MTEEIKYNIFMHGAGVRVFDKDSGRHGIVSEIKEVAAEVIEPFVLFDGEKDAERVNDYFLILETEEL